MKGKKKDQEDEAAEGGEEGGEGFQEGADVKRDNIFFSESQVASFEYR